MSVSGFDLENFKYAAGFSLKPAMRFGATLLIHGFSVVTGATSTPSGRV